MNIARRRHRRFASLALLAMALLTLAPTVNRLLAANTAGGTWVEMCTMSGLAWVKVPGADGGTLPKSADGLHADCAYCPLLNAMTALALLVFGLFPRVRALATTLLFLPSRPVRRCSNGLGSRGPPLYA